ncbi:MAG: hypothetical protein ACXWEW_09310, partial [Nitrososphaeraceae archaeon]
MTNEIFRQFSKCAKAGFLTSNKLEVMNPNYLLKKELDIEFTNIAYEIFSRYENSSSTEIKKNYEFKTARNETAVADIIVEAEKDITLIGLICSTDEPNWWDIQNLAYTYYIANQTGIRFDKVCIANIRKEYVLNNQLTHELIKIKDYTKKIIRLQPRIESTLKRLKEKLRNNA